MSNELDKHISKTLTGYESDLDTEALWQSVKPPRKPKRRLLVWFFLSLGILGFFGWWSFEKEGEYEAKLSSIIFDDNHSINGKSIDFEEEEGEGITTTEEIRNRIISDKVLQKQAFKEPIKQPVPVEFSVSKVGQKMKNAYTEIRIEDNQNIAKSRNQFIEKQTPEAFILMDSVEMNNYLDINEKPLLLEESTILAVVDPIIKLMFKPTYSAKNNLVLEEVNIQDEPSIKTKRKFDFVQLTTTYLHINRVLTEKDSFSGLWINKRKLTEQPLEAVSIGLSLGKQLNNYLQLRAGIDFTKINSVFILDEATTTQDSIDGIRQVIISPQNDTTYVMGIVSKFTTNTRQKANFNNFTQWELPIMLGYNVEKNNFHFLVEGGVRFLWKRTWKGEIYDKYGNIINLSSKDWYHKMGLSIQTGVQLGYDISPQLQLSVGVQLRYSPISFTNQDVSIKENYHLYGGQLALKWQM